MDNSAPTDGKLALLLKSIAGEFTKLKCVQCGELEFLIPVDEPFDDIFLANYHCDKCDEATLPAKPERMIEI